MSEHVSGRLRKRIIKAGHAFEPPVHCRPKKGISYAYVETRKPGTGEEVPSRFEFDGNNYTIKYVSGCFFPFIFKA